MKSKETREKELYKSGLIDSVKSNFNYRKDISEEYYILIADYIDSLNEVKNDLGVDPVKILKDLSAKLNGIKEDNLGGAYGITTNNSIVMNKNIDYEKKKLFFFHELTHVIQTSTIGNHEQSGFYNGHTGNFLTEGATQYTAEILYNVSNGGDINFRNQNGNQRWGTNRNMYSPLSEYQYNGDILNLLAKTMDLPLPQILGLFFKKTGREAFKNIYESMNGNQNKFEELMLNLEKIHSIDKLNICGYSSTLNSPTLTKITMEDGQTTFMANMKTYQNLMNKVERELITCYVENHNLSDIKKNCNEISNYLTTQEIKNDLFSTIQQLDILENSRTTQEQGFTINEYGEVIRPKQEISEEQPVSETNNNNLSFLQKIAFRLKDNNLLMQVGFLKRFINKQLNILPESTIANTSFEKQKNDFDNRITNFGEYKNLPPITKTTDFESKKVEKENER